MNDAAPAWSAPFAPSARRRAFTLVELLVVMAIITTLMGMITSGIVIAYRRAQDAKVRALIVLVRGGCERFKSTHGVYPWAGAGPVGPGATIDLEAVYAELRSAPGANMNKAQDCLPGLPADFVKTVAGRQRLQDVWGSDLVLRVDPASLGPVIWSRGRDRVDDTNFEDPPATYTRYTPPAPPAAYSDPAKFPRGWYYLGDGKSRGDDLRSL